MMPIWFALLMTLLQWLLKWLATVVLSDAQRQQVDDMLALCKRVRLEAQRQGCSEDA